jgi:type VI secretion system Hcp family effector
MALDAFLQFVKGTNPGAVDIKGETQDQEMLKNCKDNPPFDLSTWSFSVSQQVNVGSGTGGIGTGKVEFQPFSVDKQIDRSSPAFFQTLAQGGHYEQCTLYIRKAGGAPNLSGSIYLRFDFKMVFVTEITWSHDEQAPKETIKFDYGALRIGYSPQSRTGATVSKISYDKDNPNAKYHAQWSKMLNTSDFNWPDAIPDMVADSYSGG